MIVVKQVVKVRLLPTPDQESALLQTLRACNEAASWLSQRMHELRVFRKSEVQKKFYSELRERFGLSARDWIGPLYWSRPHVFQRLVRLPRMWAAGRFRWSVRGVFGSWCVRVRDGAAAFV